MCLALRRSRFRFLYHILEVTVQNVSCRPDILNALLWGALILTVPTTKQASNHAMTTATLFSSSLFTNVTTIQ